MVSTWLVFQLAGVKVKLAGETVPLSVFSEVIVNETLAVGFDESLKLTVTGLPLSEYDTVVGDTI